MKKPKSALIGQLLNVVGVLLGAGGLLAAVIAGQHGHIQNALVYGVVTLLFLVIIFGIAEILNAVVRTADACEEIAKQQRELRRTPPRP